MKTPVRAGYWYHGHSMPTGQPNPKPKAPVVRAAIEIAFIVFLFYSNLLMGEFTVGNGRGKSVAFALNDIFTGTNFIIAVISAVIGYAVFESLRRKF